MGTSKEQLPQPNNGDSFPTKPVMPVLSEREALLQYFDELQRQQDLSDGLIELHTKPEPIVEWHNKDHGWQASILKFMHREISSDQSTDCTGEVTVKVVAGNGGIKSVWCKDCGQSVKVNTEVLAMKPFIEKLSTIALEPLTTDTKDAAGQEEQLLATSVT